MSQKPTLYEMVNEAVVALGGKATNTDIRGYIHKKYHKVNDKSILAHITLCTVNNRSRIHYAQNQKPRLADGPKIDFLYKTVRGWVELYDPVKHGVWEIRKDEFGKLVVAQAQSDEAPQPPPDVDREIADDSLSYLFPLESHLRDFIANNLKSIKINGRALNLYSDDNDDGIEYPTAVGPIDILAVDGEGNFVVFELKLAKGPDRAVGQIARYMGWVKQNLASGKQVSGVIVANSLDEKLKYAASIIPDITLFEYEVKFDIREAKLHER